MANSSSAVSNSPKNDSDAPSTGNAPPVAPNPVPHVPVIPLPLLVFPPEVKESQPLEEVDEE